MIFLRNRALAYLLGLFLCIGLPQAAAAPPELSNEEIFEKAFKRKPEKVSADVVMPVFYEGATRPVGMVKTRIAGVSGSTTDLSIDAKEIMKIIERLVDPEFYKPHVIKGSELVEQEGVADSGEWIPLSSFKNQSYTLAYDDQKLELRLFVPPEIRRPQQISLMGDYSEFEEKPNIERRWLSSFLNANASQDYLFGDSGFGSGRQPLRTLFDGGLNIFNYVLEAGANYTERRGDDLSPSWIRNDVRLVHDSPTFRLRETIGDLNYPVTGFQSPVSMGGVSLVSQFGLQPSRLTVPTGSYEIFLKKAAKVQVFNNNLLIREMDLPAGRHNLRDLQFAGGSNDIKLVITDEVGQVETQQLSYFFANELLQSGLHQISYAVGAPSYQQGTSRGYRTEQVTASIFHRYGLSNSLTLGANFEGDRDKHLAGAELLFSSPIGFFKFEPALARPMGQPYGYGLRGKYYFVDTGGYRGSQRTFGLGFESKTASFAPMQTTYVPNVTAHDLNGSYGQSLSDATALSFNLGYQINRKDEVGVVDSFRAAVGLSRRFGSSINTTLSMQQSQSAYGVPESLFAIFMMWTLGQEHQTITANYNVKDDSMRATWNYNSPTRGVGNSNAQIGLKRAPDERGFDGQYRYTSNRAIYAFNGSSLWKEEETKPQGLLNTQISTALVYAGGRFALSRPVTDSFALVSVEKNLKGETIEVNPQRDETYLATTDWLGPAVVPDLSSYTATLLKMGSDKLKPGTALERDRFTLLPSYKSGYAIILGTDAAISVSMMLVNPDGSPIALQSGRVISLDDSDFAAIQFFTGRNGKTRIDGFKAGKYQLQLTDDSWEALEFEVPESDVLIAKGKVTLKPREK